MTTRNDRHLSIEGLRQRIETGDIDTVVVAFTDMQGRLQGKRLHGHYFLDHVLGHGTEGCNYLLGVDVDMNTVDGYAITSWERGYGDMEFVLDQRDHPAAAAPARAPRWCSATSSWPDHARCRAVPAHDPQAQLEPARRARDGRPRRHRAGVHRLRRHLRGGARRKDYRGLTPGQPVQRRLLDPRHHPRRAAAARHPQPHVRRRPGRRGRQGRVQPRPARDRLPLRRRARPPPTTTPSTRPSPRRSPPSTASR